MYYYLEGVGKGEIENEIEGAVWFEDVIGWKGGLGGGLGGVCCGEIGVVEVEVEDGVGFEDAVDCKNGLEVVCYD